jgi:hypothetical protein
VRQLWSAIVHLNAIVPLILTHTCWRSPCSLAGRGGVESDLVE